MTKANDRFGQTHRSTAIDAARLIEAAATPPNAAIQNVVRIAPKGGHSLHNIVALGIAPVSRGDAMAPKHRSLTQPLAAPTATNVIRFPTHRNTNQRK